MFHEIRVTCHTHRIGAPRHLALLHDCDDDSGMLDLKSGIVEKGHDDVRRNVSLFEFP